MTIKGLNYDQSADIYSTYDSGKFEDITEETTTTLDEVISQLLLYPTADSYIKINESEKQIYLPANSWTPISIATKVFSVTPVAGSTTIHWQGWVL